MPIFSAVAGGPPDGRWNAGPARKAGNSRRLRDGVRHKGRVETERSVWVVSAAIEATEDEAHAAAEAIGLALCAPRYTMTSTMPPARSSATAPARPEPGTARRATQAAAPPAVAASAFPATAPATGARTRRRVVRTRAPRR